MALDQHSPSPEPLPSSPPPSGKVALVPLDAEAVHRGLLLAFRQGNRARLTLIRLLATLDETRGFLELGYSSITGYARDHLGWSRSTTLDALRVARALGGLPRLERGFARGRLCWTALSAITRVATGATEEAWLRFARGKDARTVEEAVRRAQREGKTEPPGVGWGLPGLERRIVLRLSPSDHEKVLRGFSRLAEELGARLGRPANLEDVLLYLAELELSKPAEERLPEGAPAGSYAVVYRVCPSCGSAAMETSEGPVPVEREEVERVEGDAEVVDLSSRRGGVQTSGRGTESARGVRRKVFLREGEFCGNPRCDRRAEHWHHVVRRADGGEDSVENGVALCGTCHALVHAGRLRIVRTPEGQLVFHPRAAVPGEEPAPERSAREQDGHADDQGEFHQRRGPPLD